ncbi:MAG: hypothetical protein GX024_01215 [Clostridiales bacterium]|nr:hypothetical protein [Clostridiales bacterium]
MSKTHIQVDGERFLINGKLTYSEIEGSNPNTHGLLMNARFIQGIFDDKANPERFARFGKEVFDPEENTDALIAALPEWYSYGLRAFTVGLQGGGPVFTVDDLTTIHNTPFSEDGKSFDQAYEGRLERLIRAADEIGMIVIVSFLYQGQAHRLKDGRAVRNAVKTACAVLRNINRSNVIIEVANEHDIGNFKLHPIVHSAEGAAYLVELAREQSGGIPVGCSGGGGHTNRELADASDVILIHGNGCTRQEFYKMIKRIRAWGMNKPIVCNEDSPCIGQLEVAYRNYASWGYYNNLTKQEPPADWRVTPGEDSFFARRMAEGIGIKLPPIPFEEQYYLQGFEPEMTVDKKRWIRLASLYPESINYVEFYKNGKLVDIAYDEPFMVNSETTWIQSPCYISHEDKEWKAVVHLRNGEIIEKTVTLG